MELVTLDSLPNCVVNLRYATNQNVTGCILYPTNFKAMLDPNAANALATAAERLSKEGYKLIIWDAYRPPEVQQRLLSIEQAYNNTYILEVSNHCKGLAVDVTLAKLDGSELDMGTDHDEFTPRAHVDAPGIAKSQKANRDILTYAMTQAGFTAWPYEWWHFDYAGV